MITLILRRINAIVYMVYDVMVECKDGNVSTYENGKKKSYYRYEDYIAKIYGNDEMEKSFERYSQYRLCQDMANIDALSILLRHYPEIAACKKSVMMDSKEIKIKVRGLIWLRFAP